jgi:hypothetical protein
MNFVVKLFESREPVKKDYGRFVWLARYFNPIRNRL